MSEAKIYKLKKLVERPSDSIHLVWSKNLMDALQGLADWLFAGKTTVKRKDAGAATVFSVHYYKVLLKGCLECGQKPVAVKDLNNRMELDLFDTPHESTHVLVKESFKEISKAWLREFTKKGPERTVQATHVKPVANGWMLYEMVELELCEKAPVKDARSLQLFGDELEELREILAEQLDELVTPSMAVNLAVCMVSHLRDLIEAGWTIEIRAEKIFDVDPRHSASHGS